MLGPAGLHRMPGDLPRRGQGAAVISPGRSLRPPCGQRGGQRERPVHSGTCCSVCDFAEWVRGAPQGFDGKSWRTPSRAGPGSDSWFEDPRSAALRTGLKRGSRVELGRTARRLFRGETVF